MLWRVFGLCFTNIHTDHLCASSLLSNAWTVKGFCLLPLTTDTPISIDHHCDKCLFCFSLETHWSHVDYIAWDPMPTTNQHQYQQWIKMDFNWTCFIDFIDLASEPFQHNFLYREIADVCIQTTLKHMAINSVPDIPIRSHQSVNPRSKSLSLCGFITLFL